MSIYICVGRIDYGGSDNVGLYSTEKLAKAHEWGEGYDCHWIEEWVIGEEGGAGSFLRVIDVRK